jgi:4-oxalocrotonate tautomerase
MPLIQVKLIEEVFTPAQKREIISKLTDAMVSIEDENMRPVTWVVIEEAKSGEWGNWRPAHDHRCRPCPSCRKKSRSLSVSVQWKQLPHSSQTQA